jgi:hypothetical protein
MALNDKTRAFRRDMLIASAMIAAGFGISVFSVAELKAGAPQMAQATQPLQASPPSSQDTAPAESKPGGERPTTPAPEPAQPNVQAQKEGAKPALPPAPAEKMAAPIQQK